MTTENRLIYPHHSNYNPQKFPNFKLPKIIGYFNVDKNRKFVIDSFNCKYLKIPIKTPVHLNLNLGYECVQHKPDELDEKIDQLLRFIVHNKNKLVNSEGNVNVDVVCFRGLLRVLLCTPFEDKDSWSILATKYKGVLYLCANETEEHKAWRQNKTDELQKILSYGFKFEQYLLSGKLMLIAPS